jgi:deoxyribose-phosphate aldolase
MARPGPIDKVVKEPSIARFIDHTLLKPDATPEQVVRLCAEAREHGFATVCVNSCHVPLCRRELGDGAAGVCTVVGFPLGANLRETKAAEAATAVSLGAAEIDMVMNIGWLKAGADEMVVSDISRVVQAVPGRPVKVIIETCLLTDDEKRRATGLVVDAGATEADVRLLAATAAGRAGVKASGGIRDLATARLMLTAGATRLGTSSGVKIVEQERYQAKED